MIPGWTEGLKHIKKGGKIKLVIPPALAYGKTGVPGIPANSTLVFDVELLDVKAAPKADAKAENRLTRKPLPKRNNIVVLFATAADALRGGFIRQSPSLSIERLTPAGHRA